MANEIPKEYLDNLAQRGFALAERVGSGAYGTVYKAVQSTLKRPVAVKFFDNPFTKGESNRTRFGREAPLLARVQHPSIPYVITTGAVVLRSGHSIPYIVMQFVGGISLYHRIDSRKPLESTLVYQVMRDLLSSLDCAHQHDVVHRDVKPDNILLAEHCVFLIDFSIGFTTKLDADLSRATALGERVGTAAYAAPEQLTDSSSVDARADVYSAGVVLAEMLGARTRLRLDTLDTELQRVPLAVRNVIRRASAEDPDDRFPRAADFWAALDATRGQPDHGGEPGQSSSVEGQISDDDALVLGVVATACAMPDDATDFAYIEQQLQKVMSRFAMTVAVRRLLRLEMLTQFLKDGWNGNDGYGLRLTETGAYWAETHQKRVESLVDLLYSKPMKTFAADDDIPF